jgi:hypothetical protein
VIVDVGCKFGRLRDRNRRVRVRRPEASAAPFIG